MSADLGAGTDGPGGADEAAGPAAVDGALRCSAKGCRAAATVDLRWRNPRIHDQARVKHWLACDAHADSLADFLARRNFLLARERLGR